MGFAEGSIHLTHRLWAPGFIAVCEEGGYRKGLNSSYGLWWTTPYRSRLQIFDQRGKRLHWHTKTNEQSGQGADSERRSALSH
jgi:hypothetical protein